MEYPAERCKPSAGLSDINDQWGIRLSARSLQFPVCAETRGQSLSRGKPISDKCGKEAS